jgi:diphthine synthase
MSLKGLEETRQADLVFAEFYTSFLPQLSVRNLEKLIGKKVVLLNRKDIEENPQQAILNQAKSRKTILLVPGDPMVATTHVDLRLRAEKRGIPTKVVGAASIQTAAATFAGLQSYKFGRTITIPFPSTSPAESPYEFLRINLQANLHSLVLLDLDVEKKRYMTIREALAYFANMERRRRQNVFHESTLVVGIARAGADDMIVRAAAACHLEKIEFGSPPHCLIVPVNLHFMETEALKAFADAEI